MNLDKRDIPRTFIVGVKDNIEIKDMGNISLLPDEQVTFVTDSGTKYDFVRKEWGYYATPSINVRLLNEGFKTALVKNSQGRLYIMVVELNKLNLFKSYCKSECQKILYWLDEINK